MEEDNNSFQSTFSSIQALFSGQPSEQSNNNLVTYFLYNKHLINCADEFGRTPLHLAVNQNNVQIVEFLLSNGAEINAPDFQGTTPFHLAAINGIPAIISSLIKFGKNIQLSEDMNGKTPLQWAQSRLYRLKSRISRGSFQNVSQIQEELEVIIHWLTQVANEEETKRQFSSSSIPSSSSSSKIYELQEIKSQLNSLHSMDEIENLFSGLKI